MAKQNDWFATLLYQPEMTIEDLFTAGITPENTGLQDRDYYKNLPVVKEAFTENEKFDEKKFNSFYDSALLLYNDYANKQSLNTLVKNYDYDPFDWRYEKKDTDVTPKLIFDKNPMMISTNIKAMNVITPQELSIREIAQTNRVYDYETKQWLDWSPNDKGGLWKGLFREPLILATYDSNEDVVENGRLVHHNKGDYKYDPITGKPFYETVGNREIYDKDVLKLSDTLTKEGTKINKMDFFDSDGLDKSVGGTVMKLTTSLAPTLLALIPGFWPLGLAYGTISAAIALSQLMPTLGKAVNGFFTNDNLDTEIGKKLNKAEAWTARFGKSVSDRSREKLVTLENAASLIKDVAMQLFQQRAVQYIPRLFKNNPSIYNNAELAKTLSYAYMSGTSALESYSAFKRAGADDRVAGLGMLATTAAFYKLMSIDYFRDSFFRGSWFDDNNVKSPIWGVAESFMNAIKNDADDIAKDAVQNTVASNQRTFKALTKQISDAIRRTGKPWRPQPFWERTFAEGGEEVMEEFMQDGIKGLFNGAEALGIPMNKQREDLDFGWSWNDALQRYGMSLVGGLVGGAIFQGYNNVEFKRLHGDGPKTTVANLSEMARLIEDGRTEEIKSLIRKWHNAGRFGSNDLSGTKLSSVYDFDGYKLVPNSRDESEMSQNDLIYQILMDQVNYMDTILSQEGFKNVRSRAIDIIKDANPEMLDEKSENVLKFEEFGLHTLFYNNLTRLASNIYEYRDKINSAINKYKPKDDTSSSKQDIEDKIKNDQSIKEYENELKKLRKLRDDMFDGKWNYYYMSQHELLINSEPLIPFMGFGNLESFIRSRFGKNPQELTAAQREIAANEYEKYKNGQDKKIFEAIDIYNILSEEFADDINKSGEDVIGRAPDTNLSNEIRGNEYIKLISERDALQNKLDNLNKKENRDPNDDNEITKLNVEIANKNTKIKAYRESPSEAILNKTTSNDSYLNNVLNLLDLKRGDIDSATIDSFGNRLLDLYKEWTNNNVIKTNQSELSAFCKLLVKQSLTSSERLKEFNEILTTLGRSADDGQLFGADFLVSPTDVQKNVANLISNFYQNIQSVNLSNALKNYNDLIDILTSEGLSNDEINDLLFTDYGHGFVIGFVGEDTIPEFLSKIVKYQSNLKTGSISNILEKITATINDSNISNIMQMLDNEQRRLDAQTTLDDYTISTENMQAGLTDALYLLNSIKGLLLGASNGVNSEINKYKTNGKLAEISKAAAITLGNEIDEYINRITFLLQLSKYNREGRLSEQQRVNVNMRIKFFEKLIDKIHSEPFKNAFGFDPAQLWEDEFRPIGFEFADVDNFDKYEPMIIKFETELYNRINGKYSDSDLVKNIMSLFGEDSNIWKEESTELTANSEIIPSDFDFAVYLLSILTLNTNDITVKINDIVQNKMDKAPLYGHEFSVKIAYAFFRNKNAFNSLLNAISKKYNGSDEYFKNRYALDNVLFSFGGAGTGKTTSIAFLFKELISELDADITLLASDDEQVTNLVSATNSNNSVHKYTFAKFEQETIGDQLDPKKLKIENQKISFVDKQYLDISDKYIGDASKKVRVIIADEIETRNELQLRALSEYAQKHDVFVFALGDYNQPTAKIQVGDKIYDSGVEDCWILKTPQLTAPLRQISTAKADNANKLFNLINNLNKLKLSDPKFLNSQNLNQEIEKRLKLGLDLKYYEKDDRLVGDRIIDSEDEFKSKIDKVLSMKDNPKIKIIVDSTTEGKYQSDKYRKYTTNAKRALGGEFDYVFVDISHDYSGLMPELQMLYMLTQRARLYSGVLDVDKNISSKLNINSFFDENGSGVIQLDNPSLSRYKKWKLNLWKDLSPSENIDKNLAVYENEKPEERPAKKQLETKSGEEISVPKNDSNDTQSTNQNELDENENKSIEEEREPEKVSETKPEQTKNTIELKRPSDAPIKNAENVIDDKSIQNNQTLNGYDELFNTDETKPVDMLPKSEVVGQISIDGYYGNLAIGNEDKYNSFLNDEENSEKSLYSKLKKGGNNIELKRKYGNIIAAISLATLRFANNPNLKNSLANVIRNEYGYQKELNKYLSNESNAQIIFKPKQTGSGSDILLVLNNSNNDKDDYIEIKIAESNINRHAVYTGSFTQISTPFYTDGERIKLDTLLRNYPGLDILNTIGILIGEDAKNCDGSEVFAEINNGKSFAVIGERNNMLKSPNSVFKTEKRPNGKIWTYSGSDYLRLAGIQRIITPKEFCEYLVLKDYLKLRKQLNSSNVEKLYQLRRKQAMVFGTIKDLDDVRLIESRLNEIAGNPDYLVPETAYGNIFSYVFNDIIYNANDYENETFWNNLRKLIFRENDDQRVFIESKTEKYYIKATKNNGSQSIGLYRFSDDSEIAIQNNIGWATGTKIADVLKRLLNEANINNLLDYKVISRYYNKEKGYWNIHNSNEVMLNLVSPFIINNNRYNEDKINKIFEVFDGELFVNIQGDQRSSDGPWKLKSYNNLDLSKYSTRASNWRYSTYDIDYDSFVDIDSEGGENVRVDFIYDYNMYLDEIWDISKNIISKDVFDAVKQNNSNIIFNSIDDVKNQVQQVISDINDQILSNTTSEWTRILELDNFIGIKITNQETHNYAVSNAISKIGLSIENSEYILNTHKFGIVSDGNLSAFVYNDNDDIIKAKLTGVSNEFIEAWTALKSTTGQYFLRNFIKDTLSDFDANNFIDNADDITKNIVNKFIENYLNSETDEC